jgi:hypothetical protein
MTKVTNLEVTQQQLQSQFVAPISSGVNLMETLALSTTLGINKLKCLSQASLKGKFKIGI